MLARAAGSRNFQHFRAQIIAEKRLRRPHEAAVPIDYVELQRLSRYFDAGGQLVRWPTKFSHQEPCLWVLWSKLPAAENTFRTGDEPIPVRESSFRRSGIAPPGNEGTQNGDSNTGWARVSTSRTQTTKRGTGVDPVSWQGRTKLTLRVRQVAISVRLRQKRFGRRVRGVLKRIAIMNLTLLALLFIGALALAYFSYGSWVARQFRIDDARKTPAHEVNDGVDYVPTRPFYLFGQHFSAIAAAGPIAGPILAAQNWGWFPALMWIGFGVVFIGAVHDFSSLTASVRHGARSIAEITREHLGTGAGRAMMMFIWIVLIYVIIAFTQITAGTFVSASEELQGVQVQFNAGGAVAAASIFYLALAVVMGVVQRYVNPPLWLMTAIFVPAALATSWLGTYVSQYFIMDARMWGLLILAYCCVASVMPVWALLQPRGYLGGFILYLALGLGVIGVLFGGYDIKLPAFRTLGCRYRHRNALPVPVRHNRVRRVLRFSRSRLQRNNVEASRS